MALGITWYKIVSRGGWEMTFATTASGPHAAPDAGLFSALGSEADLVGRKY